MACVAYNRSCSVQTNKKMNVKNEQLSRTYLSPLGVVLCERISSPLDATDCSNFFCSPSCSSNSCITYKKMLAIFSILMSQYFDAPIFLSHRIMFLNATISSLMKTMPLSKWIVLVKLINYMTSLKRICLFVYPLSLHCVLMLLVACGSSLTEPVHHIGALRQRWIWLSVLLLLKWALKKEKKSITNG